MQEVIARCFELELSRLGSTDCYFTRLSVEIKSKRDQFANILQQVGLNPVLPDGGYCMLVDISPIVSQSFQSDESDTKDRKFVKYLIREKV